MEPENNWRQKTLEYLEKDYWSNPGHNSRLVNRCHELRKIPLNCFTTEDLRIMIGQQIGLDYLIPLAIETLAIDLFAEGDFFKGDLLKAVLSVSTEFWNRNKTNWLNLDNLIKHCLNEITSIKQDTSGFYTSIHSV